MRTAIPDLVEKRREEIVDACETLYQTHGFKEITIKDISKVTSFSRPTIYNYFETKEEIFLALYQREYERWNADLLEIRKEESLTKEELAKRIAVSLEKREQLLKLLSMNNYDMEANSRTEFLTKFKEAYGASLEGMDEILQKFLPEKSVAERQEFRYIFFPFMFGIYPYAKVTEKQKVAMEEARVPFVYSTIYEVVYSCLMKLL